MKFLSPEIPSHIQTDPAVPGTPLQPIGHTEAVHFPIEVHPLDSPSNNAGRFVE